MGCPRCSAITDKGQRCKRNTCLRYPYCYQHQKKIEGLELKQSRIPDAGKGAFATKVSQLHFINTVVVIS